LMSWVGGCCCAESGKASTVSKKSKVVPPRSPALPTLPALPRFANMFPIKILDRHPLRKSAGLLGRDFADEDCFPSSFEGLGDVRRGGDVEVATAQGKAEVPILLETGNMFGPADRRENRQQLLTCMFQQPEALPLGSGLGKRVGVAQDLVGDLYDV